MVTVTDEAKRQLKRLIESKNLGQGKCLRLATPPQWVGPGDWGIVITEEGTADYAVSLEGEAVLHIDPVLADRMASAVLDFKQDTPHGPGFTLDVY